MDGVVAAVSVSAIHTFSKANRDRIRLLAGLGVEGDAHVGATVKHQGRVARDPKQPNLRQVHLIHAELHDELGEAGFTVRPGELGENITTCRVDLLGLPTGTLLHLGREAVVEVTGLRNPCRQIDDFQPGLLAQVLGRAEDRRSQGRSHGHRAYGRGPTSGRSHPRGTPARAVRTPRTRLNVRTRYFAGPVVSGWLVLGAVSSSRPHRLPFVIFKRVGEGRPYPDHGTTQREWAQVPPRPVRLDQLVTTKRTLDLDTLLADDSTYYGDLFAHVVEYCDEFYLEDGLHRALRAALHQRMVVHARVLRVHG